MRNLQNEIGRLSAAEKIDLLDAVRESLENDQLPFPAEQREELDYRVARCQRSPSDVTPSDVTP